MDDWLCRVGNSLFPGGENVREHALLERNIVKQSIRERRLDNHRHLRNSDHGYRGDSSLEPRVEQQGSPRP